MPLETAEYFDTLQPDWPLGTDPENQGDDHIRMIKQVIQNTFPNLNGAVTGTPDELNNLSQITWRNMDENPSQFPYHGYWQPDDPAGTGAAAMTSATLNSAMVSAVPSSVITWTMVQNLIYPVHSVLISSNSANPATYLGFGTWVARAGTLYGAGSTTDSYSMSGSVGAGKVNGNWRIPNNTLVGTTLNLSGGTATSAGGHAHGAGIANPSNYADAVFYGQRAGTGSKSQAWAAGGSSTNYQANTSTDGAHTHPVTGTVTIGSGTTTSGAAHYAPGWGFYVWERTA